jgi:uncharacterized protein (DUF4415 family)
VLDRREIPRLRPAPRKHRAKKKARDLARNDGVQSRSSTGGTRSARHIPDRRIDFSEIPESTDAELKRAGRVGRPKSAHAKQLIAIRLDPRLLARLRRLAREKEKPYQTLIHELLEKAAGIRRS